MDHYTSYFYEPYHSTILFDAPVVQDPVSTFFDYEAYSQEVSDQEVGFDVKPFTSSLGMQSDVTPFYPTNPSDFAFNPAYGTQPEPICVPTADILGQSLDDWFASQVDAHPVDDTPYYTGPIASSPSDLCPSDHEVTFAPVNARSAPSVSRPRKRKVEDSDYEEDSHSDYSEYIPRRPAKRSAPGRKTSKSPLPAELQPIKVSSTYHLCPMRGCRTMLEDKDSTWRGHFKKAHHDELCLIPGCRGSSPGTCKAFCPSPIPGCKTCAPHGHSHGVHSKKAHGGAMTVESVGRHLLNIHYKVAYRCPLCGLENEWRESACARHIRRCLDKHEEAVKKRAAY